MPQDRGSVEPKDEEKLDSKEEQNEQEEHPPVVEEIAPRLCS